MIFNRKENACRYLGLGKNMDKALVWIENADFESLKNGRTDIDHDNIFVNVMDAVTKPRSEGSFEFHKNYYDIQVLIHGKEDILFGIDNSNVTTPYKEDIGFCSCPCSAEAHLTNGCFVICEPLEPHAPCIATSDGISSIRKAVIKVLKD